MINRILKLKMCLIVCMVAGISLSYAQNPALEWAKGIGDEATDIGRGVTVDPLGNVYSVGYFAGTVDFDPGAGISTLTGNGWYSDAYISKLDSAGNFIWAKRLGGPLFDGAYAVTLDESGNVYTVGYFSDTADFDPSLSGVHNLIANGDRDVFVSKLDSSGNFVWAIQLGGIDGDEGYAITADHSGHIYVSGNFVGTVDFDPGSGVTALTAVGAADAFVAKFSTEGQFVWAKTAGGKFYDFGYSVAVDKLKNVYLKGTYSDTADFDPGAGIYELTSSSTATFVLKLNEAGDFVWARQIKGAINSSIGKSLVTDACGDLYMTGTFTGTVDFDPGAATYNLVKTGMGGDGFVTKWNSLGDLVWAKSIGGAAAELYPVAITLDATNNVYTTGFFNGFADFDPDNGTVTYYTAGGNDIYISKLDASGSFVWAGQIGGLSYEYPGDISADDYQNIYISGYYESTLDMDPDPNTSYNLSSFGDTQDAFVIKLSGGQPGTGGEVTFAITGEDSVCPGQVYTYSVNNFPAASFTWNLPQGWTGNSTTNTITVTAGEEGGVLSVTANRICDTTTRALTIELRMPPVDITVNGSILGTTNTGSYTTWQWFLEDIAIVNATNPTYTVTANGMYSVVVTASGCSDTARYQVTNTAIDPLSGIAGRIRVYPNPATDYVHIQSPVPVTTTITHVDGRRIQAGNKIATHHIVDVTQLASGIYLLHILDREGHLLKVEKMIKSK
jgi:uncharacterized protein (DUF2249 family)